MLQLAVDRADGSPEFLLDLLAAVAGGSQSLPDSVDGAASARIDALDPGDRALVQRAAVLGLVFHEGRLRDVLPTGAPMPDKSSWRRLRSVFARDDDGHIRFKRPALQEVAYEHLPFRLRRELHASVARALEPSLGRDVDADPAILSRHFELAGDNTRAWKYALLGAERARERFAHADAAHLYRRALTAGRHNGATPPELAAAWESLGEALTQVGELPAAARAFTSARGLLSDDPVAQARLCFRHGEIAERGQLASAVRWMSRGIRTIEHVSGPAAHSWRARLIAELGWIRQRQGRHREAVRLCREALRAGEESGDLLAEARACYTLDWAAFEIDRAPATHSPRALEIYRKLGDPQHEAMVLINLGARAYWQGRWQEAVDLYVQGGQCSERAGNAADVAFSEGNVGEILSDQGHLDDAAGRLRRAYRLSKSTGDREGAAFASMLLGRLDVRAGRPEEGIPTIRAAAEEMRQQRFDYYADCASALVAEAEALGGSADRALAIATELLTPGSRYASLLHRSRGVALARLDDRKAAIAALEQSVAAARQIGEDFELVLTLDALAAVRPLGPDERRERDEILERLGIVRLPTIPGTDPAVDDEPLAAVAAD
jgi:tetratricopeptide (TPR) repeat protein